jgi:hypothetical protein
VRRVLDELLDNGIAEAGTCCHVSPTPKRCSKAFGTPVDAAHCALINYYSIAMDSGQVSELLLIGPADPPYGCWRRAWQPERCKVPVEAHRAHQFRILRQKQLAWQAYGLHRINNA